MFCGFQSNAFQNNAFQILKNPDWLGGGGDKESFYYLTPYQRIELEKTKINEIKEAKEDLTLVEAQITKSEQKYNLLLEKQIKEILELQEEKQLYQQISQLRILRAELIQRIKENEAFLVILFAMKRRKLRAV